MAKKRTNPTEARLDIRLNPATADALKSSAKEAGVSLNQLMKSICIWTAANMNVGKPNVQDDLVLGSTPCDGMFWLGQSIDDETGNDGDVYAVFDFSTNRAIRHPAEFFHSEENPND